MFLAFGYIRVILYLALLLRIQAKVEVENNAFQNIVVSFSSRLVTENPKFLVDSVKDILEDTSKVLQTAVGIRIKSVKFFLPQNWDVSDFEKTPGLIEKKLSPSIVIESLNDSAFGKLPYTLQYGGCGVPGLQITVPDEFLRSEESYPKSKILAREWLKYQYGVFDENGFQNDPFYPSFFTIPGSDDIHVTDCTSPKVEYTFRDLNDSDCTLTKDTVSECLIHPGGENLENITSSLMFFHKELPLVDQICGKDHTHNVESLNKHNLLCNYKSILEVIKNTGKLGDNTISKVEEKIQFSFFQESKLRLVVAWQSTKNMEEQGRIIFAAAHKLMYDVPLHSELGLYRFADTVKRERKISELLSDDQRKDLRLTSFNFVNNPCPTCVMNAIVEDILKIRKKDPTTIVIITASNPVMNVTLIRNLKSLNLCLVVIGFSGATEDKWRDFMDTSDCKIFWEIDESINDVERFKSLYEKIISVLPPPPDDKKTFVVKAAFINESIEVPTDSSAESYNLWIFEKIEEENLQCLTQPEEKEVPLTLHVVTNQIQYFSFEPQSNAVICKLVGFDSSALALVKMTTKKGAYLKYAAWVYDSTTKESKEQMPVIIYAQLFYGQYPIKNAHVIAQVYKKVWKGNFATEKNLMNISLFDDGRGDPDITRYDGIYSRYFTEFESEGEYIVKIIASDNGKKATIGKNGEDPCCGSVVVSESVELHPFNVTFYTKFKAISEKPATGYKPSRVVDLRVDKLNLPHSVTLSWTAPGGEMDQGQASRYEFLLFCNHEDCSKDGVLPKWVSQKMNPKPQQSGSKEAITFLFHKSVPENLLLSFALKGVNDRQQIGDISNIALFKLSQKSVEISTPVTTGDDIPIATSYKMGNIIAYVIIAVAVAIMALGLLFFLSDKVRHRRKLEDLNTPDAMKCPENSGNNIFTFQSPPLISEIRRTESFPVILYTHDQIKDYKDKAEDHPLYKTGIPKKPWASTSALINDDNDGEKIGLNNRAKTEENEIEQLEEISETSEPSAEKNSRF